LYHFTLLLKSLPKIGTISPFIFNHPDECVVIVNYGFNLCFSAD
jgi:hypothetical protein